MNARKRATLPAARRKARRTLCSWSMRAPPRSPCRIGFSAQIALLAPVFGPVELCQGCQRRMSAA
jgi:hypothetical protein